MYKIEKKKKVLSISDDMCECNISFNRYKGSSICALTFNNVSIVNDERYVSFLEYVFTTLYNSEHLTQESLLEVGDVEVPELYMSIDPTLVCVGDTASDERIINVVLHQGKSAAFITKYVESCEVLTKISINSVVLRGKKDLDVLLRSISLLKRVIELYKESEYKKVDDMLKQNKTGLTKELINYIK